MLKTAGGHVVHMVWQHLGCIWDASQDVCGGPDVLDSTGSLSHSGVS